MTNETLEVIKRRRSIRAFLPDQIADTELEAIVEAGLSAPNGGMQSWHFSVVQNAEVIDTINTLAKRAASTCGLPWLESLGNDESFHCMYNAPTVILVSGDPQSFCEVPDTAAATENMLLAAESLNIGSCWGYFATQAFQTPEGDALRERLGIPDGYNVCTSIMLGHKTGEEPEAPERKPNLVSYTR